MKRNQDRVHQNASPAPAVRQGKTTDRTKERPEQQRQAIVDLEMTICEAIGIIEVMRRALFQALERCPTWETERIADASTVGLMRLADGIQRRLYRGYHKIDVSSRNPEQGRATA